jgi:hypothetical protein
MADDALLFTDELLQREIIALLGDESEKPSIAYIGPILETGRMDAVLLADGLKGYARFVNRIAEMLLGPKGEGFHLEVDGEPQKSSLEVFVRFLHPIAQSIRDISDSKLLVGLSVVATLSGLSLRDVGKSLIWLFKHQKGRPIDAETDLLSALPTDSPIDLAELIRIFNDPEVQAALRAALRPLREQGIETFETRRNRKTIESVSKFDLLAADSAELEAIISDEEKTLDIEKVSFFPHLAWHLSDKGKPFDAKIEDRKFWEQIAAGDRFGYGDKLRVSLHTEAERDNNGHLRTTRTVTKVHRIERPSGQQIDLF